MHIVRGNHFVWDLDLDSKPRILITAGPTHEPIDAVRYLANRSSGKMGIALANASARRGWPTTLLLGPVSDSIVDGLPESSHFQVIRFQTTADLHRLLKLHWPSHSVLFMAAAVADYRPIVSGSQAKGKIKRQDQPIVLNLESTPDLLADISSMAQPCQIVVGFALEPAAGLIESARSKLNRKKLDAIVANPLQTMDSPNITATVLLSDGKVLQPPPDLSKETFAAWLLDHLDAIGARAVS